MASVAGKDVNFYVLQGSWLVAVCAIDTTLSRAKAETTVITKCGSETTPGPDDDSVTLNLTLLTGVAPAGQIGSRELDLLYDSGDEFNWMIADDYPAALYVNKKGKGVMTALEITFPAEGLVNYAFTIKVNGTIINDLV